METWFISDTHFGHAKIIQHCNRPFASVEEMDAAIIERWNARVSKGDRVYHLGDFAWTPAAAKACRPQLNGAIRLVVGNHDPIKSYASGSWFQRVYLWKEFREYNFVASHMPLRLEQLRKVEWNVHGHVHNNEERLDPHHVNISLEMTDYAPIHLDELRAKLGAKS